MQRIVSILLQQQISKKFNFNLIFELHLQEKGLIFLLFMWKVDYSGSLFFYFRKYLVYIIFLELDLSYLIMFLELVIEAQLLGRYF